MTPKYRAFAAAVIIATQLSGCGSSVSKAPVSDLHSVPSKPPKAVPGAEKDWRPQTYIVQKGDTLYGIAFNYGLDYHDIATLNNIQDPNLIKVGQELRLFAPENTAALPPPVVATQPAAAETMPISVPSVTTTPLPAATAIAVIPSPVAAKTAPAQPAGVALISQPLAIKLPYSSTAAAQIARQLAVAPAPAPTPAVKPTQVVLAAKTVATPVAPPPVPQPAKEAPVPDIPDDAIVWAMPTSGKLISGFSENDKRKGIDLAGTLGQPVLASADGKVVYSGSGLRGYGNLIIIKHNKTYLSAYAHNDRILVKEGQSVAKGQKIAEMGNSDADRVELHFEIRKLGKPVDPADYLPMTKS